MPAPVQMQGRAADLAPLTAADHQRDNAIVRENQLPGTTAWMMGRQNLTVAGVAVPFSSQPGDTVALRMTGPGEDVGVKILRLGWYGGAGARLVADLGKIHVTRQPDATIGDAGLANLDWGDTTAFKVGDDWPTGVYEARLSFAQGDNYVPFVVRSVGAPQPFLYHTGDFTWQAYNQWGGTSLYGSAVKGIARASIVSLDRPLDHTPTGTLLYAYELPAIRFLERNGYGVDYASDADLDRDGDLLLCHKAVLTPAHDEYWTGAMRDHYDAARDRGVHLAFLGANMGYWQVRLDPPTATSNGRITCYKSTRDDPVAAMDPRQATDKFQSAAVGRPEDALMGVRYDENNGLGPKVFLYNLTFGDDAEASFGIPSGTVATDVLGREWDVLPPTPLPGLHVLAVSERVSGFQPAAATTLYQAPSGALVFSASSMGWGLGFERWVSPWRGYSVPSPAVQAVTQRLLDAMDPA